MKKIKVAVAMSGGVDSGVAAALVAKAGYQAAGFHMHLWSEQLKTKGFVNKNLAFGKNLVDSDKSFINKCCSTESLAAARKTAHQLGLPFYVINFKDIFKKRVVDYFLKEYGLGRTPNPCVMCNRFIKFGELLAYIKKLGYDYLATGHYARVECNLTCRLLSGRDKAKDQSYFLYNLTQKQLARVMFPVGDYLKSQVRQMAKKECLPVATRPESQEVCFFPESDYRPFLKRQISPKIVPGEVVDAQGKMIGRHRGLPLYTIGQRHGFEITAKKVLGPLYVIAKKIKKNQLVVGFGKEAERKEFFVKQVNWIDSSAISRRPIKCQVRIRHQGERLGCKLRVTGKKLRVVLAEPERGIAPSQAAVFYKKEAVLGGGLIVVDNKE